MSDKDKKPSIFSKYSEDDKKNLEELNKNYIDFLSVCKTERESVEFAIEQAQKCGYKNLREVISNRQRPQRRR